jgi:NAD(P)-dependent dehydrogenase (short-subunit alcohol dehydrogenase family)
VRQDHLSTRSFHEQQSSPDHRRRQHGCRRRARLAADGFQVGILSSSGRGEALAAELGGIGVTGSNQSVDDLQKLVDQAVARWGRVDVLVNSAGHGPRAPILDITDEDWHRGMDTYLLNVIRPTRLVTPLMQRRVAAPSSTSPRPGPSSLRHVPDLSRVSCRAGRVHQALRRQVRAGKHPHQQRPARLDRQPAAA